MIKRLFFSVFIIGLFISGFNDVFALESAKELIEEGDLLFKNKQERYLDLAAEKYWKAILVGGGQDAIQKLTDIYNGCHFSTSYDWEIVRRYAQKAADVEFERSGRKVEHYDNTFFIIAPESAIVEKYAVKTISKKWYWGGNTRVKTAIESLYKKYYLNGKNGRFKFRAEDLGPELGPVAILDPETAKINFDLNPEPATNWSIYVKSPANPHVLIPFESFHRYVYQSKMGAFLQICNVLGAKNMKVYYSQKDKTTKEVQVNANAIGTYEGAQAQMNAKTEHTHGEIANFTMVCMGTSGVIHSSIKSPWLDSEPTWHALVKCRTRAMNPVIKCDQRFEYLDDYRVNVKTKAAFEKSGIQVGVGVDTKFEKFQKIRWIFEVEFHPVKIVLPLPKEIK